MNSYLNEFTSEYWRGHKDRSLAPDYVTRLPFDSFNAPVRYAGRINGEKTHDQTALRNLRKEILISVYKKGQ